MPKDGRPLTKTKGVKLFRSPREPAASGSKKMKPNMKFLWRIIALYNIVTVYAGFGDPRKAKELLRKQYGQPCDCRGGQISEPPSDRITQVTCTGKTAYLMPNQLWKCKSTPRDTSPNGPLLECLCSSFQSSVHSSCYTSYQQCKSGNRTYYTATLLKTQTGGINDVQVLGSTNKLVQSPCNGQKGKPVCWSTTAPIHISDGGGPLDIARIKTVQKKLEEIHKASYPELQYHPLALPELRGNFKLDAQTFDILNATYNLLQMSNTSLAHDCWLCLKMGPPIPLAIPNLSLPYVNYSNESLVNNSCPITPPPLSSTDDVF
ncbi:syncytin-1-like [Macaca nemestrina]|uniref:syncytin-1-like n=1 Tax=Macaca nemestrina TaxID=9545 RepID=UPI0039B911ED